MTTYRCPTTPALRRVTLPATLLALAVATATSTICLLPAQAWAADDVAVQRLATCQDSWSEWQEGDPHIAQYRAFIQSKLIDANGGAFTPKASMSAFGLPVTQVYPMSVGMGVGFSMLVTADLAQVRQLIEKAVGKPLTCATTEGSPGCELKVGKEKTVVLMTDGPRGKTTLAGCYYFYSK